MDYIVMPHKKPSWNKMTTNVKESTQEASERLANIFGAIIKYFFWGGLIFSFVLLYIFWLIGILLINAYIWMVNLLLKKLDEKKVKSAK